MWNNLTHLDLPILNFVVRAMIVYFFLLFLIRISGKRQLGQMGATEFVTILLISNAVQNSMNGGDNSLVGGLILAAVLIILSAGITFITYRSSMAKAILEGTPTLLVHKGTIIRRNLIKERLDEEELNVLLRKQGVNHLKELVSAILEIDGSLSIIKVSEDKAPA